MHDCETVYPEVARSRLRKAASLPHGLRASAVSFLLIFLSLLYLRYPYAATGAPNTGAPSASDETAVALDGSGNLTITDINGGISDDNLTLTRNGANLRITDPGNQLVGSGLGVAQVNSNTVDVPLTTITGDVTIDTLDGLDTVNLNAALDLDNVEIVVITQIIVVNAPLTVSGSADINLTAHRRIVVNSGADLTTQDGDIILTANQGDEPVTGDYAGLWVAARLNVTGAGSIALSGQGGTTGESQMGIVLSGDGGMLQTVVGDIVLNGQGGESGGDSHGIAGGGTIVSRSGDIVLTGMAGRGGSSHGVRLMDNALISTTVGSIVISGTGGTSGDNNFGVTLEANTNVQTGEGAVTLDGQAGAGAYSHGVFSLGQAQVTSRDGDLNVRGVAGSGFGYGVRLTDSAQIASGIAPAATGNLTINAVGRNLDDLFLEGSAQVDGGSSPALTILADALTVEGIINGSGNLLFTPHDPTVNISLGVGGSRFNLDDSELAHISDGFAAITIGDLANGTGTVTLESATFADPVTIAGGTIHDKAGADIAAATNAVILAGNVAPGQSPGVLNVTGNFAFADNDTLSVEIGGSTPGETGNNHDQINVVGSVIIGSNVALDIGAVNGYMPTGGETFVILNNDGSDAVSGTFGGLAEGATLANFLGSGLNATLTYVGGDGNDIAITVATAETSSINQIFLSSSANSRVADLQYRDEDILLYNLTTQRWSTFFDGSDVGVGNADLDAFTILADGAILMSFDKPIRFPTLGVVDDSDIVKFIPTVLGNNTAGRFELFFDGSDVELTTGSEDIDAIAYTAAGNLLISTYGTAKVGTLKALDEDLLLFTPTTLGTNTAGSWTLFFDGSAVNLRAGSEDVNAAALDGAGNLYLATKGNFSAASLTAIQGDSDDLFGCTLSANGENNTLCTFFAFFDGDIVGFKKPIDGLSLGMVLPQSFADRGQETATVGQTEVDPIQFEVLPDDPVLDDAEFDLYDQPQAGEEAESQLFFPTVVKP